MEVTLSVKDIKQASQIVDAWEENGAVLEENGVHVGRANIVKCWKLDEEGATHELTLGIEPATNFADDLRLTFQKWSRSKVSANSEVEVVRGYGLIISRLQEDKKTWKVVLDVPYYREYPK